MSNAVNELLVSVRLALQAFDERRSLPEAEHEEFCTCHRCVFVRGVRGELAAFDKAQAKLEARKGKK